MGILLTIAYDGTDYCGWQIQKNGPAVQQVVETALGRAFGHGDFALLGASRTDAGVHALGQRGHVVLRRPCRVPTEKLAQVVNSRLPRNVRIMAAAAVPDTFHPINDCISKTYCYKIYNAAHSNPLEARYAAFVPAPLDIAEMAGAAAFFVGEHDFAAFCASGSSVKTTVRRIFSLNVIKTGDTVEITVAGNGFLYNMVRILAGTLADVGLGKTTAADISAIIHSRDRSRAGKTMPPQGLTLLEVVY